MVGQIDTQRINWHQAIVEVSLIFAGVLTALAVDSWWDERQERVAETQYLLSLRTDFEANREQLGVRIAEEQRLLELGERLHAFVESDSAALTRSELNSLLSSFFNPTTWTPVTGTYEEMLGSGRLLFIQNRELRSELSQYAHLLSVLRGIENSSWTNWYLEQSPFLREHLNLSEFDWFDAYYAHPSFDVDIQQFRSRKFHNLVASWMLARSDVIGRYRMVIAAGDKVLGLVDLELDNQ